MRIQKVFFYSSFLLWAALGTGTTLALAAAPTAPTTEKGKTIMRLFQKSTLPAQPKPATSDKPIGANNIADANNRFGLRLFDEVLKTEPGANVCVSPTSIALALQMTYNGAQGTTQTGMARALHLDGLSLEAVNTASRALLDSLAGAQARPSLKMKLKGTSPTPGSRLDIANSLWFQRQEEIRADFIQRAQHFYNAEVHGLQGAPQTINAWVSQHTNAKIPQIVTAADVRGVEAVLVNAVYFKGLWETPFESKQTVDRPFHLANGGTHACKMMMQEGKFDYHQDAHFQMVSLPYSEDRLDMVLLLPDAQTTLNALVRQITPENWHKWTLSLASSPGTVGLPRFRAEFGVELKKALSTMGMQEAFEPTANFAGLSHHPLFISKALHKTFVEVNEQGTEAAAASAVLMPRSAGRDHPQTPFRMILDRPFFYAIRDRQAGALLFLGTLANPE